MAKKKDEPQKIEAKVKTTAPPPPPVIRKVRRGNRKR